MDIVEAHLGHVLVAGGPPDWERPEPQGETGDRPFLHLPRLVQLHPHPGGRQTPECVRGSVKGPNPLRRGGHPKALLELRHPTFMEGLPAWAEAKPTDRGPAEGPVRRPRPTTGLRTSNLAVPVGPSLPAETLVLWLTHE